MIKNAYCYDFKISDIHVRIISEISVEVNQSFAGFANEQGMLMAPDYTVRVRLIPRLQIPEGKCVYHGRGTAIFRIEEGVYFRVLQEIHYDNKSYAVSFFDWDKKEIIVEVLEEQKKRAGSILEIFKCIAWETVLLHEKHMMLHASYVKTSYGGLAFSGPSGIGKTTQAKLWSNYKNAEMINGDKVILYKKDGCWYGYGSPYAGSSKCYVNDSCELKYLFLLKQGTSCSLKKLSLAESFKQIYTGITLNRWNAEYVQIACDLVEELVADIPVYEFTCTPDQDAVDFLEKKLEGGELGGFSR